MISPGLFYVVLFNGYSRQMLCMTRHWFFSCFAKLQLLGLKFSK